MSYKETEYTRKCYYIHDQLDIQLGVKAAELKTDKSNVLNRALEMYFQNKPQKEIKK